MVSNHVFGREGLTNFPHHGSVGKTGLYSSDIPSQSRETGSLRAYIYGKAKLKNSRIMLRQWCGILTITKYDTKSIGTWCNW